jgi:hypothetical protein
LALKLIKKTVNLDKSWSTTTKNMDGVSMAMRIDFFRSRGLGATKRKRILFSQELEK